MPILRADPGSKSHGSLERPLIVHFAMRVPRTVLIMRSNEVEAQETWSFAYADIPWFLLHG